MTYHSGKPSMPSAWSAQVHGKVQPLRPSLWGRIRAMLCDDAAWRATYCGLVWLAIVFCGPVFAAVAAVLIFGG